MLDVEPEAVEEAHVDIGDEDQSELRQQVAAPAPIKHLEAGEEEHKGGDVVGEAVFAGEEIEELAPGEGSLLLTLLLAEFPGFAEDFFVGHRPTHAGNGNSEQKQNRSLVSERAGFRRRYHDYPIPFAGIALRDVYGRVRPVRVGWGTMDWKSRKVAAIAEAALAEDKATNDVTTALAIDPEQRASATVLVRQDCTICGLGAIGAVFDAFQAMSTRAGQKRGGRYEVISHPEIFDGVRVRKGQTVAVIRHNAAAILSCERVILNLLQRMSGIATLTREFVTATEGTRATVLDTRKTMPGLRLLDKYAVCCGGGANHRLDLQEGIMLKQSHLALAGGIEAAVARAVKGRKAAQKIEIEVSNANEAEAAIQAGADVLLFVHMSPREVALAVETVRAEAPHMLLEVAEHLNLENVREYAETGVDFLSVGGLTRSAMAVDLSMRITADVY